MQVVVAAGWMPEQVAVVAVTVHEAHSQEPLPTAGSSLWRGSTAGAHLHKAVRVRHMFHVHHVKVIRLEVQTYQ